MDGHQKIIADRVRDVVRDAEQRYNVDLLGLVLRFDLHGKCAGQALYERDAHGRVALSLRINREAYDLAPAHVLHETIPHEIAHLICFLGPRVRSHGPEWRRVFVQLILFPFLFRPVLVP